MNIYELLFWVAIPVFFYILNIFIISVRYRLTKTSISISSRLLRSLVVTAMQIIVFILVYTVMFYFIPRFDAAFSGAGPIFIVGAFACFVAIAFGAMVIIINSRKK